jgi:predicted GNAT family N-acyltransferase
LVKLVTLRGVELLSFPEMAVPVELRIQVREIQRQQWPLADQPDLERPVHDPRLGTHTMLLVEDETVVASLDLLFKRISHTGVLFEVGGLSTVVTRETSRGRGLGLQLITAAREAMGARGLDAALFTADRHLSPFYERAGFQVLLGTVLIGGTPDAPFPSDQPGFDKVTLGEFYSPAARAARFAFDHARVELFPGEIDKLW